MTALFLAKTPQGGQKMGCPQTFAHPHSFRFPGFEKGQFSNKLKSSVTWIHSRGCLIVRFLCW